MMGKWSGHYSADNRSQFGDADSYKFAEKFLSGLDVEDWGCGNCRFKDFHDGGYVGIDGSDGPTDRIISELSTRKTSSPGILIRHVLEHNPSWCAILANAVASCTDTLVVALFTPLQDHTHEIGKTTLEGVSDIGFSLSDLRDCLPGDTVEHLNRASPSTQYGVEHFFVVKKDKSHGKT